MESSNICHLTWIRHEGRQRERERERESSGKARTQVAIRTLAVAQSLMDFCGLAAMFDGNIKQNYNSIGHHRLSITINVAVSRRRRQSPKRTSRFCGDLSEFVMAFDQYGKSIAFLEQAEDSREERARPRWMITRLGCSNGSRPLCCIIARHMRFKCSADRLTRGKLLLMRTRCTTRD